MVLNSLRMASVVCFSGAVIDVAEVRDLVEPGGLVELALEIRAHAADGAGEPCRAAASPPAGPWGR